MATEGDVKFDKNEDGDRDKSGMSGRQIIFWTFVALTLSVLTLVVQTSFSLYLDTALDAVVLFVSAISIACLIERLYAATRMKRLPNTLWAAAMTSMVFVILSVQVAQPPAYGSQGTVLCTFGHLGFGYGTGSVWVKAETAGVDGEYRLDVNWGPEEYNQPHYLVNETYFTFDKLDFRPGGNTSARITPAVRLSCGNGKPPSDATVIPLVDWQGT
jgi:hypothetical protein